MEKIAFIIAFKNFRDEEYFVPKEVFEKNGFEVKTVSSQTGLAIGGDGGEVVIDFSFEELEVADYSAIVMAGGPGAYNLIENKELLAIIQSAKKQGKLIAAICIAPAILAKSGILQGKKATIWSSPMDKSPIRTLKDSGADYLDKNVVEDGNIITANGPSAAKEFAQAVVEAICVPS